MKSLERENLLCGPLEAVPQDNWVYLIAGRLSANYKVLIWDRHNGSGASDIAFEEAPSDMDLWAADLHHLLHALDMSPAVVAGGSGGAVLALLMAHSYPEDVKGLILDEIPTDNLELMGVLADGQYFQLASVAESEGMRAVLDSSIQAGVRLISSESNPEEPDWLLNWIAETVAKNPGNRDLLLSTDPIIFAQTMRTWGNWYLTGRAHLANLSDAEIRQITVPALVVHGLDEYHPRHTAERLHGLLPNSVWAEFSDHYSEEEIDRVRKSVDEGTQRLDLSTPIYEAFLQGLSTD